MTHGGNTVGDSKLIMNYLSNTYLSHEEGAASGAGARPTSSYLAFLTMTRRALAGVCKHQNGLTDGWLERIPGTYQPASTSLPPYMWLPVLHSGGCCFRCTPRNLPRHSAR